LRSRDKAAHSVSEWCNRFPFRTGSRTVFESAFFDDEVLVSIAYGPALRGTCGSEAAYFFLQREMKTIFKLGAVVLVALLLIELAAGALMGPGVLHPARRPLTPELVQEADAVFAQAGTTRTDFVVRATDGVDLRGWKVRPRSPNGDWILLFHGVADNRTGMLGYAGFLLRKGYSLVMMDARAHGNSGGSIATYGWKERYDTRAIVDSLYASENVHCLFAMGESMGAAIALQSAAVEPRIAAVVAESAFSNLREASYDYAGFHLSPWLGRTLLRPAAWAAILAMEKEGGFPADKVSPEEAVAHRPFPVLLICDGSDHTIPCRHSEEIYRSAAGPKQLWRVPGAGHTGAHGEARAAFERRVLGFLDGVSTACGKPGR
jgi:alpha-beta hydrolase superfamily lysophospholipase